MFGEISHTGKDRLNVKGKMNVLNWRIAREYYRLNGNQEIRESFGECE